MNADRCVGAVGLFTLDTFNVDDKLLSVDLNHFAHCIALVVTTNNLHCEVQLLEYCYFFSANILNSYLNFIVFTNWHGSDIVLLFQFL